MDAEGTTVILGDPFPEHNERAWTGGPMKKGPGYAIVWNYDQSTGLYEQKGSIVTSNVEDDELGWSVDISDDGSVIIVGSRATCTVRILRFIAGDREELGPKFIGNNCADYGWRNPFGTTVRLSGNGRVAAIAAPFSNDEGFSIDGFDRHYFYKEGEGKGGYGRVAVLRYDNSRWWFQGKLLRGDSPHEAFGLDLALSEDGTVFVGHFCPILQ